MSEINQLLAAAAAGDPKAAAELLPIVYEELRVLAVRRLAREPGKTWQPTALVHEAYLRLVESDPAREWSGRGHFFAAAAEAMRRILIDHARRRLTTKHGGGTRRIELPEDPPAPEHDPDDLLALDEALTELSGHDPQAAELVKLRYFVGLSHQEAAEVMGVSRGTADRLWALARAWLYRKLSAG